MKTWKILSGMQICCSFKNGRLTVAKLAQSTDVSDMSKDIAFRHGRSASHQKCGGNDGCFCISSSNAIALAVRSSVHLFSPVQMKNVWK